MTTSSMRPTLGALLVLLGGILAPPPVLVAQQFDVRGTVLDSAGAGVPGAMVVALARADSAIAAFATTAGSGAYTIRDLPRGAYILQVTRTGFMPTFRNFDVAGGSLELAPVALAARVVELDELVVNADHIPIVNKPDTLEYNALAFKTRINATAEELLKLLPGIQVESDGTITAQGKTVQKVLVDGKEFFGRDPKVATQNLPADAIDKVQVFDKRSDMAEFTGIDDGNEEKTINLELKPEARVGYFGQVLGGVGPGVDGSTAVAGAPSGEDARYTGALMLNRFSPTLQLSGLTNLNNLGQGGFGKGGGQSEGFHESFALGLNASRDFGAGSWIRSSFSRNDNDDRIDQVTSEQQLQGAQVANVRDLTSGQTSSNLTNRLNLDAQYSLSSWHQLRFRGSLADNGSSSSRQSDQETRDVGGAFKNSALTTLGVDSDNLSGNANLTWRKRLNTAGRSLVAEATASLSSPDRVTEILSSTAFVVPGGGRDTVDTWQTNAQDGRTLSLSQRLSVVEPLGSGQVLELFGQHRSVDEDQDIAVADLGSGTPVPNALLSSAFERTYSYLNGGTRLSRNSSTARWTVGLEVQRSQLDGTIIDRDETISNGYTHWLPSANLRQDLGNGRTLTVRYTTNSNEPSLTQLQPFSNVTNPLNVYVGNPDLQPEYRHNGRVEYRFFDQFSFLSLSSYVNVSTTLDEIVSSRMIDAAGKQEVMPVNHGTGWATNVGASLGSPIRRLGIQFNLDYSFGRSTGSELVNTVANDSRVVTHGISLKLQNRYKQHYDLTAGAKLNFNSVAYSLNDELNKDYLNTTLYADGSLYLGEAWTLSSDVTYQIYDQQLFGQVDNVTLLQASISHLVLGGLGEVEFAAMDLLDQNQGVSIISNATLIREQRTASLGRHLMLRFSYRLGRSMTGRGGGPRGGGDRR